MQGSCFCFFFFIIKRIQTNRHSRADVDGTVGGGDERELLLLLEGRA